MQHWQTKPLVGLHPQLELGISVCSTRRKYLTRVDDVPEGAPHPGLLVLERREDGGGQVLLEHRLRLCLLQHCLVCMATICWFDFRLICDDYDDSETPG